MRFSVHSLRIKILGHLAFLILSAMLLINVVALELTQKDLTRGRITQGRVVLQAIGTELGRALQGSGDPRAGLETQDARGQMEYLLAVAGFEEVVVVDREGVEIFYLSRAGAGEKRETLSSARRVLAEGPSYDFYGNVWGVIWMAPKGVRVSAPLMVSGAVVGGMTTSTSLTSLYASLRGHQRLMLAYIGLNTLLLLLFGIHLLSRSVVKPIHGLLRLSEEFRETDTVSPSPEGAEDEIGELRRSLGLMLRRLKEDEQALKHHIASLEKANVELKAAQADVVRSEKLASVGRLSAGIAHEIGNPLGIVLGYLDLLGKQGLTEEERRDFLERAEAEIQRIHRIIRQLLDFSRPSRGEKAVVSVHALLAETLQMMAHQPVMARLEGRERFKAVSDQVCGDPALLRQVFVNILMNAADAMDARGEPPGVMSIETQTADGFIEIRFADTGSGIPEEILGQIFDPFFTTKEPGKGTGLGLSVSHAIVQDLGGTIEARSTPGKGTTMIVRLPLCRSEGSGAG